MNKQTGIALVVTLAIMGGAALWLNHMRGHQQLGQPGVKTSPIANSQRVRVELPERALDYSSESVEQDDVTLSTLPKDTSFGTRRYKAADGFQVLASVVLMGGDRTSIHKPQFCLRGSGWVIQQTDPEVIHMDRPKEYDLPVMKLTVSPEKPDPSGREMRGFYVYWFVADKEYTRDHWQRMWWMAKDMLSTGVLQRWSYITYFATFPHGYEEAAFERMKKLIAASAPEFQLTPGPVPATVTANH
jgi:hypothetical protein